jgi:hypothetical protein
MPKNLEDLKANIRREIRLISKNTLTATFLEMQKGLKKLLSSMEAMLKTNKYNYS